MLHVNLKFRRRILFFLINYLVPILLITIVSIFGFVLPAKSEEKTVLRKLRHNLTNNYRKNCIKLSPLEITNLLGVLFFNQYVSSIVPSTSLGLSKLSIYFEDCFS